MVTKGEWGDKSGVWDEQIHNMDLPYSTGDCTQDPMTTYKENESEKEHMYSRYIFKIYIFSETYIWITLLYTWNKHSIVDQLHVNLKN